MEPTTFSEGWLLFWRLLFEGNPNAFGGLLVAFIVFNLLGNIAGDICGRLFGPSLRALWAGIRARRS